MCGSVFEGKIICTITYHEVEGGGSAEEFAQISPLGAVLSNIFIILVIITIIARM